MTRALDAPRVEVLPDSARSPVTLDGPLNSVQGAIVSLPPERLEELWHPESLERLARAYWQHVERLSLGALRIAYEENSRAVRLFGFLELLRFHEPRFKTGEDFGSVTWPIDRGLLVAKRGRGQGDLAMTVRRRDDAPGTIHVRTSVSNFYPWLRGSGRFAQLGRFIYSQTQLRIHVFVTKGFLRSLERLDLPQLRPERRSGYLDG